MKRVSSALLLFLVIGMYLTSSSQNNTSRGTVNYQVVQKQEAWGGMIKGYVFDDQLQSPIAGVNINIVNLDRGATTDAKGEFVITGLENGFYELRASHPNYHPEIWKHVEVTENSQVYLMFKLRKKSAGETEQTDTREYQSKIDDPTYYVAVEQLPELVGGIMGIQEKVVYPEIARRAGIEGTVFVEVFINQKGEVEKTFIIKGIGAGCDEAAIQAILASKFIPGKQQGKPVKVRMVIPIRFILGKQGAELNANVQKQSSLKQPSVFIVAGPKGLIRYITYPAEAARNKAQGVIYVDARLNVEKRIVGVNLKRGIAFGVDQDVMRAVMNYNFAEDPEIHKPQSDTTISIVVQFLLPLNWLETKFKK